MAVQEYISTITVKQSDLGIMAEAQLAMYDGLMAGDNEATFKSRLNAISFTTAILAFFCPPATVLGLTSLFTGIISTVGSEKSFLANAITRGKDGLLRMSTATRPLTKYDLFEIEFICLDYTSAGKTLTVVESNGTIKRAHVKGGGWVSY
ncbi:hypothetical protein [Clostridium sp.]|uniref:hypothetical protein n=1 Tax=Clostridium sp. TaxID=1506 RepID=UPI003216FB1C